MKILYRFLALILLVLLLASLAGTAFAANTVSLSLPVKLSAEGNRPNPPETYTLVLQADDKSSPMPSGSSGGSCSHAVTGPGDFGLPAIVFDKPGVYGYTLSQLKGKSSNCTYDATVYDLKVTVSYSQNGSSLELTLAIYPQGDSVKASQALFVNKYAYPPTDTPRTGDGSSLLFYGLLGLVSLASLALVSPPLLKRDRGASGA